MKDIAQHVTNTIVDMIKQGQATGTGWTAPWSKLAKFGIPMNATTRRPYRGINVMLLWAAADDAGYESNEWATFKQWKNAGYRLKDAKGCGRRIVFWKILEKEERQDDGTKKKVKIPLLKSFVVFNAAHAVHFETGEAYVKPSDEPTTTFDDIEAAQNTLDGSGAIIRHNGKNRAFYDRLTDSIHLPAREQFHNAAGYYSTAFHELTHWTGHESRMAREFGKRFGDEAYAFEELIAELGAAFLCASTGVASETRADHAEYVANWLRILRNDKNAIITAANQAGKAMDFIQEQHEADEAA